MFKNYYSFTMLFFSFLLLAVSVSVHAGTPTGAVVAENAIIGASAGDKIGSGGVVELSNGNIVISSPSWNGDRGAVTCLTAAEAATGGIVVSASNSLVGSTPGDGVGSFGIEVLSNGNYVVTSYKWDNGAIVDTGAVTWVNGATCKPRGANSRGAVVSTSNSLYGTHAGDQVGGSRVRALSNGNYVVRSPNWNNGGIVDAGAVTWGNGTVGTIGAVSTSNSLYGTHANDQIGIRLVALSNGNYVTSSREWDNGTTLDVGAITWGNGTKVTAAPVSTSNSLYGGKAYDFVGERLIALSNGNYVTSSIYWDNGSTQNVGAVTWGNGFTGTTGKVTTSNSLYGTLLGDAVGYDVIALTNGHYVVISPIWDNGAKSDVGAVTWGNGNNGSTTGAVSTSNSLYGTTANDQVGYWIGGVTPLTNGNYVVVTPDWDNGGIANAGAVTWGNGNNGSTTGAVSTSNSLYGTTANDQVGSSYGVTALSNGNYVVTSEKWDNGAIVDAGAVTWANGTKSTGAAVTTANSLYGTSAGDQVGGAYGVTELSNGNYVAISYQWDNGAIVDAGAVTWGNGTTGKPTGAVSTTNSLYGTHAGDQVGYYFATALTNGNYVVTSRSWDNGGIVDAGAVTLGNGTNGTKGPVNTSNSLYGTHAGDQVGGPGVVALGKPIASDPTLTTHNYGNYVVISSYWDNGGKADVGAVVYVEPVLSVEVATSTLTINEDPGGNGGLRVRVSGGAIVTPKPVTLKITDGTTNSADYTQTSSIFYIPPGDYTSPKLVPVPLSAFRVNYDNEIEIGNEWLTLTISSSDSNLAINPLKKTVTVTILDAPISASKNGGFEGEKSGGIPTGWVGKGTKNFRKDKQKCNKPEKDKYISYSGDCAFLFKGNPTGEKTKINQKIDNLTVFTDGASVVFSVYVDKRSAQVGHPIGKFIIKYKNGDKDKLILRIPDAEGYSLVSRSLTINLNGRTIDLVKMQFRNRLTGGKFFIDDASLMVTPATALKAQREVLPLPEVPDGFRD